MSISIIISLISVYISVTNHFLYWMTLFVIICLCGLIMSPFLCCQDYEEVDFDLMEADGRPRNY